MRKKWDDEGGASPIVRDRIEKLLAAPYRCHDGALSWCESWTQASEIARSYGLDIGPPPTTATEKVERLRAEKNYTELNRCYARDGLNWEHEREQRALKRWQALRKWAQE
jgi:hypothetical protein